MKRYFIFLITALLFSACGNLSSPEAPKISPAQVVLDGPIDQRVIYWGGMEFSGMIKNIGTETAYDTMIIISCYADISKKIMLDMAKGFPENSRNINPGQKDFFSAIAYHITSYSQVAAFDYKIIWADKK